MADVLSGITGVFNLHTNATYGRISLVRTCLLLGADVNGQHTELQTSALHAAAYNGHLPVVKYLIEAWNANPLLLSADGWTALHCAAMNGFLPVVKYLLEEASIQPPASAGKEQARSAGQGGDASASSTVSSLEDPSLLSSPSRIRPTSESNDGWTALHCAAANGFLPVVKYLVEKHAMDVEFTTYTGWTPLHWACCNGYVNVARYLLSISPSPSHIEAKTECGSTIVHVAARQGHSAVVQWLVDPATGLSEELLKCKNDAGMDAFTLACMKGHLRVVEMLVDRLSKSSFLPSQIQRAHDLHQAASIQEKYNLNRALVKYLREWMQEMQYGQASESPEEETVEVLTMREMLAKSDLSRTVGGGGVGGGQGTTDSSALLGSSSSSAPIPEAETEEDESEEEEDEEEEESESASKPLSSPPALDNAHLKRSALINDATTVADATIVPSQ